MIRVIVNLLVSDNKADKKRVEDSIIASMEAINYHHSFTLHGLYGNITIGFSSNKEKKGESEHKRPNRSSGIV